MYDQRNTMPHRILHITSSLDRYSSAADAAALAASLPADEFTSHMVALGRPGPLTADLAKLGVELVRIDRRWRLDPLTLGRLAGELRRVKPHIVHTWDDDARRYALMASRRMPRRPLIAQWQPSRGLGQPLMERLSPAPDRWVVESPRHMQRLAAAKSEAPLLVIPPGVAAMGEPAKPRGQVLAKLGVTEGARLIGTAGPLVPTMGVKELIWAADMVRVLHPKVRLLIAGEGPERPHLELFARTAAEPENILLLGDCDDWPHVLPHLDVYWQGTERGAVSPPTLLQAMAAGVPVVASDTLQHQDWLAPGEHGLLVAFDARADRTRVTDELFTDAALRGKWGAAAKQHALKNFSLVDRAAKFATAYRSLVAEMASPVR